VATALILLTGAALALGLPPRPTLPVGAVDTPAVTGFVIDGLRCLVTVAVWYFLLTTAVTTVAALPRVGAAVAPVAGRLTGVGVGVVMRRVLTTSAVVGVSLPGAAGAEQGPPTDEPPVMVPIDPAEVDAVEDQAMDDPTAGITTVREAETREEQHAAPDAPAAPVDVPTTAPEQGPTAPTPAPEAPGMHRDGPRVKAGEPTQVRGSRAPTTTPTGRPVGSSHHVVQTGESFWTIAAGLARTSAGGEEPDLETVAAIWQQLIDHNADILVEPGNPDLLHRGQRVDLSALD